MTLIHHQPQRRRPHRFGSVLFLMVAALAVTCGPSRAEPRPIDEMLGFSSNARTGPAMQRVAHDRVPTGTSRVSVHRIGSFYKVADPDMPDEERPKPDAFDAEMIVAFNKGQFPVINPISAPMMDAIDHADVNWYEFGRALAERFRPGSDWNQKHTSADWGATTYMLFNEYDGIWYHGSDESRRYHLDMYAQINGDFARGVRSVYPEAKVYLGSLALGHAINGEFGAREWVKAAAPLFHSDGPDRIDGFGLQDYFDDDGKTRNHHLRIDVQAMVDDIVEHAGIAELSPDFYSTEFNVRPISARREKVDGKWQNHTLASEIEEDKAAEYMLTFLWNMLSVVHPGGPKAGEPATQFALPFSVFSNGRGQWTMLAADSEWTDSFSLNKRGQVLELVARLGDGLVIESIDEEAGLTIASGDSGKLWAWTNLPNQTNLGDGSATSITLEGLPADAEAVEVYYYDSVELVGDGTQESRPVPADTLQLDGNEAFDATTRTLKVDGLRAGQTVMFRSR